MRRSPGSATTRIHSPSPRRVFALSCILIYAPLTHLPPKKQAVNFGPTVSRDVATILTSFAKAPLLLCRSFEDDAFAIQPERDPELHDQLIKMWLRNRAAARPIMWKALQKASKQKVIFDHGDSAIMQSPFTTSVTVSGAKISVDVFVSESLPSVVKRCGLTPGMPCGVMLLLKVISIQTRSDPIFQATAQRPTATSHLFNRRTVPTRAPS